MKLALLTSVVALGISFIDTPALADDPHDPLMRDPRARARDHEIIRQLNLAELRKVRARDARMAQQWRVWREWKDSHARGN